MQNSVNAALRNNSIDTLAQKLDTTVPTLQMIIDGLKQPRDYDIRAGNDFQQQPGTMAIIYTLNKYMLVSVILAPHTGTC